LVSFSALCAAKAFTLEETVKLVRIRGKAMQGAVAGIPTSMVAVFPVSYLLATEVVKQVGLDLADRSLACEIANINGPNQVVLSGHKEAVDIAVSLLVKRGTRVRAVPLNVTAPFHSRLMQPAAEVLRQEFEKICGNNPVVPLISNITATTKHDISEIKSLLINQTTSTVNWYKCVEHAISDMKISTFIEISPKSTLSPLIKKIDTENTLRYKILETAEDIEKFDLLVGRNKKKKYWLSNQ